MTDDKLEKLIVSQAKARELIGVSNTKYHAMKRAGMFEIVNLGGWDMVAYRSLVKLIDRKASV